MINLIKVTRALLWILVFIFVINGCLFAQRPGYQKNNRGLEYKIIRAAAKSAVRPEFGDAVQLSMVFKNGKDSIIFDNRKGEFNFTYIVEKPSYPGDFNEALRMFAVGDSGSFIQKADSFYLHTLKSKSLPSYIKKGSELIFNINVLSVTPNAEFLKAQMKQVQEQAAKNEILQKQEIDSIQKYLEKNKISVAAQASGLYYLSEREGNGPQNPQKGNKVIVNYKVMLLNGTVIQSTYEQGVPLEFVIGGHSTIKGLEEGVCLMKKGGKAKLLIPSKLGYGDNPAGDLPAFTTLIYVVELIDVK